MVILAYLESRGYVICAAYIHMFFFATCSRLDKRNQGEKPSTYCGVYMFVCVVILIFRVRLPYRTVPFSQKLTAEHWDLHHGENLLRNTQLISTLVIVRF